MNRLNLWIGALVLACAAPAAAGPMTPEDIGAIQQRIRERGLDWTAGETRFTRMDDEQRARLTAPLGPSAPYTRWLKCQPPPDRAGFAPRDLRASGMDWRDHLGYNWDTPIRDQGDCGSCWAFSTIAALELLVAWRESTPDPSLDLSEQQLFDCSMDAIDCETGGITWYTTGSFLSKTGVTSEACYPYTSGQTGAKGSCPVVEDMSAECQRDILKVDDLTEITETLPAWPWDDPPEFIMSPEAMALIKAYLQERPVGVSYRVYNDFYSYTGGIYEPTTTAGGAMHAVLIVGYDDVGGYWIVKNSWGDDFGEKGYFRIRYNTSSFGMFAFVYEYQEDRAAPAFCPDLPARLELDRGQVGSGPAFTLANCGGGVLDWTLDDGPSWFSLRDDRDRKVQGGAEVAAGSSYSVVLEKSQAAGTSAAMTLRDQNNHAVDVTIVVTAADPADGGSPDGADGGSSGDGGTTTDEDGSSGSAGCASGGGPGPRPLWLLLVLGLFFARRAGRFGRAS